MDRARRIVANEGRVVRAPVLLYHRVVGRHDPDDPRAVTVDAFERHMRALESRGLRGSSIGEIADSTQRRGGTKPSVGLTFDDGYEDVRTRVAPVLERFGFSATVFLVTGRLGGHADWTGLEVRARLLDWDQVRELSSAGIEFGSHTRTHARLDDVTAARLRDELAASRSDLERGLGRTPRWVSYPYGVSSAAVRDAARAAGYEGAFGVLSGPPGPYNRMRVECRESDGRLRMSLKARPGWWRVARIIEKRHLGGRRA